MAVHVTGVAIVGEYAVGVSLIGEIAVIRLKPRPQLEAVLQLHDQVLTTPAVVEGRKAVMVSGLSGRTYYIHLPTHQVQELYRTPQPILHTPLVVENHVLLAPTSTHLHRIPLPPISG